MNILRSNKELAPTGFEELMSQWAFFNQNPLDTVLQEYSVLKQADDIKNLNNKKTRIHSIEFGVGPEVSDAASPKNFLRRLSRQNGGTYRYYDVTKFK